MQKANRKSKSKRSRPRKGLPPGGLRLVPSAYVTQLAWPSQIGLIEAALGVGDFHTYALTNLFDPDYTGAGNQPIGFDQVSTMYNRFRVMSVRIVLEFANNTNVPVDVGYVISTAPTLPASPFSWCVQRIADQKLLSYNTGGNSTTKFVIVVSPWEVLGIQKRQYIDEADYSGTSAAGPSRTCYLNVWTLGRSGTANVQATIRFYYKVELSEALNLGLS